ncbi:MAG: carboxypeptidase-like regulatory domain-containing protein [Armatimonadota bacterium]|nr:carboxypeptidase-like regulatory domain-containing protein [Armatimonadota bacterium]
MRALMTVLLTVTVTAASAEEVTITGRVVGPDGEGIAGARVATGAMPTPDEFAWLEATTDAAGRFRLTGPITEERRGHYVACVAQGYAVAGGWFPAGEEIKLRLSDDPVEVSGTVFGRDGDPLAGAQVRLVMTQPHPPPPDWEEMAPREWADWTTENAVILTRWSAAPMATSDEDGRFSLGGVPAGSKASLQATADGYVMSGTEWLPDGGDAEIALRRAGSIAGRVTFRGEPIAGATVRAGPRGLNYYGYTAETDATGRYRITGLPAGTWLVSVKPGRDWCEGVLEGVEVVAGEVTEGADVTLSQGAVVEGSVTWADTGEPVPEARISIITREGLDRVNRAHTDEAGHYALRVPPGAYRVHCSAGRQGWGPEDRLPEIELKTVGESITADLSLLRQPIIALTVTSPDGTPAAGVEVLWYDGGGIPGEPRAPERGQTDANGRITIEPSARTRSGDGPWHPRVCVLARDVEAGRAGFRMIEAGGDYEIPLVEGGWLVASVRDSDGAPVADAGFTLHPADDIDWQLPLQVRTGQDGSVRIGPLPGGMRVSVRPVHETSSIMAESPRERSAPIEVIAGETVELPAIPVFRGGLSLRGTVVDAAGRPVEGARVLCDDAIDHEPAQATTDAQGRFELTGLRANRESVTVVAADAQGTTAYAQVCDPKIAHQPTFELAEPATVHGVLLTAEKHEPVAGGTLEIWTSGSVEELPGDLTMSTEVTTGANGEWRVEGLVPGVEYRATFRKPAGRSVTIHNFFVHGDAGPIRLTVSTFYLQ